MSWVIEGPSFVRAQRLTVEAKRIESAMKDWLKGIDKEKKLAFINDLFSVMEAPGVETLTELQNGGLRNFPIMALKTSTLTPETKEALNRIFATYLHHWITQS